MEASGASQRSAHIQGLVGIVVCGHERRACCFVAITKAGEGSALSVVLVLRERAHIVMATVRVAAGGSASDNVSGLGKGGALGAVMQEQHACTTSDVVVARTCTHYKVIVLRCFWRHVVLLQSSFDPRIVSPQSLALHAGP